MKTSSIKQPDSSVFCSSGVYCRRGQKVMDYFITWHSDIPYNNGYGILTDRRRCPRCSQSAEQRLFPHSARNIRWSQTQLNIHTQHTHNTPQHTQHTHTHHQHTHTHTHTHTTHTHTHTQHTHTHTTHTFVFVKSGDIP